VDFPQPRGSASSPARASYGDVSGAMLPHLPLHFQTVRRKGPCSGARNSAKVENAGGGRPGAYVLKGYLHGEDIARSLIIARPGYPTSTLG
jgi:hypothetical protein